MHFGNDDYLSDGSNDSFFEDPKILTRRPSNSKTPEKKVSDLFNLADEKDDIFSSLDATIKNAPTQKKKQINFADDDEEILAAIGFEKKKPPVKEATKKSDLLESILAPKQDDKKTFSFEDILKESKAKKEEPKPETVIAKPIDKPNQFILSEAAREGRRTRRLSTSLADPLGLFDATEKPKAETTPKESEVNVQVELKKESSKTTSNVSDLPDWLGGGSSKASKSEQTVLLNTNDVPIQKTVVEKVPEAEQKTVENVIDLKSIESNELFTTFLQGQKLSQSDIEVQSTFLSLQQQESQLLIALQLKKYEENLTEIQRQQQEVLMKQEKQFNIILDNYLSKQKDMEKNMRLQQERINNHMQMLISNVPIHKTIENETQEQEMKVAVEEEMKAHEKIIESLKTRHHEEMFIMEESYKKQISLLETSIEKYEEMFKDDMKQLTEMYEEKITRMKEAHAVELNTYEEKFRKLQDDHKQEMAKIKDNYLRTIEDIKSEHNFQLETLKQLRDYEANVNKDGNVYSQKLDYSISMLNTNSQVMQNLQENMQEKFSVLSSAREASLAAKEKELTMMKEALEKCRESAELERSQLLGIVRNLEIKIAEQSSASREERWALQQASSTLAARAAALDREFEFNKTSVEREREQIKVLKEALLAEQERTILQLNEEKLAIASERSRLETSAKLHSNFDAQRTRAEIEAAIQVAKESAEMTDRERANLQRQHIELEKLKRTLVYRERMMEEKERELQSLQNEAERKIQDAEAAVKESKATEMRCKEQMRSLQLQLNSLGMREKKLSEDKIALSKERLVFYTNAKQRKRCRLCEVDSNLNVDSNHEPEILNVFDDDFSRVRFDMTEEERNSEVSREISKEDLLHNN